MPKREARRYRRVVLDLPVHVTVNTVDEYEGRLLNISPGDMAIIVDADVTCGDAVSVRVSELDVIEGTIARKFPDGFAVSFLLPKRRRDILTEKLILKVNPSFAKGLDDRRTTPRHASSQTRTICRLSDGAALYVKILDRSVDGVSVDAPRKPALGSSIHIGRQRGVVARHTPRGFVVVYDKNSNEDSSDVRQVS